MLNEVLRRQGPLELLRHAVVVTRTINEKLVSRLEGTGVGDYPAKGVVFRGGGLPDEHRWFFQEGRKYRVPNFLATSFKENRAKQFLRGTGPHPPVLWRVMVDEKGKDDPTRRCRHVSFLRKSHVQSEKEFLFAPYSVFTVEKVAWSPAPSHTSPHTITLRAALDNIEEPEDLPLAPWS